MKFRFIGLLLIVSILCKLLPAQAVFALEKPQAGEISAEAFLPGAEKAVPSETAALVSGNGKTPPSDYVPSAVLRRDRGADGFEFEVTDGEATLTSAAVSTENIVIPDTYEGVPVTRIGDFAFNSQVAMVSVTIPSSVTEIGRGAFYCCSNLKTVNLSEGLTLIGEGAFASCNALSEIKLPSSVQTISDYAFDNSGITSINLPIGVELGQYAFANCNSLTRYVVEEDDPLRCASAGIVFSRDGKEIQLYPAGRSNESFSVPEGVEKVGPSCFFGAINLTEVHLPGSIRSLDDCAFYRCRNLKALNLPEGLETTGDFSLMNIGVTELRFPDSLNGISYWCCKQSANLKRVYIGKNAQYIDMSAFADCYALEEVCFSEESQMKVIWNCAFQNCTSLTSIILPDSAANFREGVFDHCSSLETVQLPASLTEIGWGCFGYCNSLTEIALPDQVAEVNKLCFRYSENLQQINIPDSVTYFGKECFIGTMIDEEKVIPDDLLQEHDKFYIRGLDVYPDGELDYDYAGEVLRMMNEEREKVDAAPLLYDEDLAKCAQQRAVELSVLFSHDRPMGFSVLYTYSKASGENIAAGYGTPSSVMNGWMNSPGHRQNILRETFCSVGVACFRYNGSLYWVQLFGTAAGEGVAETGQEAVTGHVVVRTDANYDSNWYTPENEFAYKCGKWLSIPYYSASLSDETVFEGEVTSPIFSVENPDYSYLYLPSSAKNWHVEDETIAKWTEDGLLGIQPGNTEFSCTAGFLTATASLTVLQKEEPHTHHYVAAWRIEPTCTEPGCTVYVCDICGDSYTADYISALGHDLIIDAAVPATCTEDGLTAGEHCTRCDYKVAQEVIPSLGHDLIDHEAKAPTCTEKGWKAYQTCSRCDYTSYEEIAALGHDIVTEAAAAATCTEPGLTEGEYCTRCDYKVAQEVIPALGHEWGAGIITVQPTETEPGEKFFTCSRCGETKTEVIPELEHVHSYTAVITPPTCTEQGYTTHTCACGDSYVDTYVPALGHDIVTEPPVAATCTEPGLSAGEHCTRCDYQLAQQVVAPLGHDIVTDPEVAATCTQSGLTEGKHCTRCDYKVAQETVPALGHAWNEGEITTPATETEDGVKTFTCTRCGATRTELIPATGEGTCQHEHTYPEHVDPTCTEPGYDRTICSDCGNALSEETIPALGHDFVTDAAVAPTCTEPGLTGGKHCSRCDYKEAQEIVAALGHTWNEGEITTPATETEDGVKTFTCTRCGETRTETIPATGEDKPCDGGPTCPSYRFTDVKAGDWYHEAVDFAVTNGLFNGMSETTFEPNTPMTRGMLVTVLWRYEGCPQGGVSGFADVKASDWFSTAVAWAARNKIVTGVGDNKFDPNGKITREQLAAILFRYSNNKGYDTSQSGDLSAFPDAAKVSGWAKDACGWAVGVGLISGNNTGGKILLDPQGNATRAQVATILMRFIEKTAK